MSENPDICVDEIDDHVVSEAEALPYDQDTAAPQDVVEA